MNLDMKIHLPYDHLFSFQQQDKRFYSYRGHIQGSLRSKAVDLGLVVYFPWIYLTRYSYKTNNLGAIYLDFYFYFHPDQCTYFSNTSSGSFAFSGLVWSHKTEDAALRKLPI